MSLHASGTLNFSSFYIHYVFGVSCFNSVFMFRPLFYFIIDVLKTVDSGPWMYFHMIIDKHSPIKDQKYASRYVWIFWFEYKYT